MSYKNWPGIEMTFFSCLHKVDSDEWSPFRHNYSVWRSDLYVVRTPTADRPPAAPSLSLSPPAGRGCYRANHVLNGIAGRVLVVHFN